MVQLVFASVLTSAAIAACVPMARAQTPPKGETASQAPTAEAVRAQAISWLDHCKVDEKTHNAAAELWAAPPNSPSATALLERLVKTFALGDPNAGKLVDLCSAPLGTPALTGQSWLKDPRVPPLEANNLRLWYARWLVHQMLYEEAQEQLGDLRADDVVDPASLLFYQALVSHRLLNKDAAMEAISRLRGDAGQGPRRYLTIARLMEADLKDLKEDSLDHIARRMQDVQRRLDLGRAGKKVRGVEDGIVASLDKLIKQLEDQQQSSQSTSGNSAQSRNPAQESMIRGGKAKGEVEQRNIGNKDGWGNLPPKQREEALQQIGRDFPAHYRDVIEQYFRKLASEGTEK